jgi:phospholipid/cholesterol/gamma-HCH transport system substrate-binding protein
MSGKRLNGRSAVIGAVTVLAALSAGGLSLLNTDADQTTVYAYFKDASPLIVGNDVKMHGVKIGVVDSIEVENGQARVGLRVEPAARPLHTDAAAVISPVGLLGERYVDLDRGSASAPVIPTGGKLPARLTSATTGLDEVINTLDDPTSAGLAALVTTFGEGLTGTGANAADAIKALAPAMQDTGELVRVLNQQSKVLTQLLDSLEPVVGAVASDHGKRLDQLVGSADRLLSATAQNQDALDQTLTQLPGALAEARQTLRTLSGAAHATTPNLRSLRPTTDHLDQLSQELVAFSNAADPALNGLDPVLEQGRALIENARPVVAALRRAGPDLRGTMKGARPVVTGLLSNLRNVLDFVKYWALTTNGEDGLSHYFRAHLVVTSEIASGLVPGGNESSGIPGVPTLPSLPGLNLNDLQVPDLPLIDDPLGTLGGLPVIGSSLTPLVGRKAASGSATGLTAAQENSLLDSLIGGN